MRTIKISIFLSSKNGYFPKGFTLGFGQKSAIFSSFFFSKIVLEVMFSYGLGRKEACEDEKNVHFNQFNPLFIGARSRALLLFGAGLNYSTISSPYLSHVKH